MSARWLEAVADVARLTGQTALTYVGRGVTVETKGDGTPVTVADRAAEQAARDYLNRRFPEDGVLGEEGGESRAHATRRWIIDPIDGTKAFIRGVPLWGTLVALAEHDTVLAGAIYMPVLDQLLVAERGQGCFLDGTRVHVSSVARLEEATVLTTEGGRTTPELRRLLETAALGRSWGDCYGYLLVATGQAEAMVDPALSDWDSAALQPIIEEAGGVFTALDGRHTAFGKSAVATNAALADGVRAALRARPEPPETTDLCLDDLNFDKGGGLVSVVTQDARTGAVLMVAWADRQALESSMATGYMNYRSRTRGPWKKGEHSGNIQRVIALTRDCDGDAVLARVVQEGPACHTGAPTCFGAPQGDALSALARVIEERASTRAQDSYTGRLLGDRNLRLKKLGEETAELVLALADGDARQTAEEAGDVVYHLLVALRANGITLDDVREVVANRSVRQP